MILTLALNYSARSELVDAFHSMLTAATNNGGIEHLKISEETISQHLYTSHLPDPDLVIRTSGELRLSNFLLVAVGLRRNLRHAHAVARIPRHPSARRHRRLPKTRPPLRRIERISILFPRRAELTRWNSSSAS